MADPPFLAPLASKGGSQEARRGQSQEGKTGSFDRRLGYALRGVKRTFGGIERDSEVPRQSTALNRLNAGTPSLVISGFEADKRSRPRPQPAGPLCGCGTRVRVPVSVSGPVDNRRDQLS